MGGALFKVKGDSTKLGDKFTVEHVYTKENAPTRVGGAVLVGDYLYGTKAAGLRCVEFTTAAEKWHVKSVGPGSVCFADGRLYLHGENGEVALVEATPEAYREKGRFTAAGRTRSRQHGGMGLSGRRQRAVVCPRTWRAVVLRCQRGGDRATKGGSLLKCLENIVGSKRTLFRFTRNAITGKRISAFPPGNELWETPTFDWHRYNTDLATAGGSVPYRQRQKQSLYR